MAKYLKRYIEKEIEEALLTSGVVVVVGPKFCGKTTTSKLFAKSSFSLNSKIDIQFAEYNTKNVLKGLTPRLIDEWQNVPDLWNCAREFVDESEDKFGQLIFTGSSTPANFDDIYHSGAGRIITLTMRTMSLYESLESTGDISLNELFIGKKTISAINNDISIEDIAFYICRGGWPLSLVNNKSQALKITKNYYSTLFEFENSKNKKFRNKKKDIFIMILKSYARNISTEVRKTKIIADINLHDNRNLDLETFDSYKKALEDLYIIKDIEAWNPNFRSKTSIITTPTRHFVDPSIAAGALKLSPSDLLNDPKTLGLFFEDFVIKELSIYASYLGGEIRHYRDGNGLECDAVMHLENGKYALIEIKLGGESLINEGSLNLLSLRRKIINDKQHEPEFMMIITATGNAYTTQDGIHIVPINMLKD